jgi:hypothetical protein
MKEGLLLSIWCLINVTVPFEILKGCYFGLRNLNFTAISRKVQMFLQEYVIHEVSRCGHEEYICYLELATGGI